MAKVATKEKTEPIERSGTTDVSAAALGALRDFLLASDEVREAQARKDAARAALDEVSGTHEAITCGGAPAYRYRPGSRRVVDADRLAERYPEVFADVVRQTSTSTLVVEKDVEQVLRQRTWRAALTKRPQAA